MSHRNDSSGRHRKSSRSVKNANYPMVSFDGCESIDIPLDDDKSPVNSRYSLASNPTEFKFMDEIALLKRGRIDKDAPKHPYNRRGQPHPPENDCSIRSVRSSSSWVAKSPAIATFMGVATENEKIYKLGNEGILKVANIKGGGERYEVTTDEKFAVYQQSAGQTCLFTYKL